MAHLISRKLIRVLRFVCLGLLLSLLFIPGGCTPSSTTAEVDTNAQELRDKSPQIRQIAALNLGRIGSDANPAIPKLLEALRDDEEAAVRASAANALGSIGTDTGTTVPALITALKDTDEAVRAAAAKALSQIGTPAVSALMTALPDSNPEVRRQAAFALGQIGEPAAIAIPALIERSQDHDRTVQQQALEALGQIHADPQMTVPVLIAALKHHDWQIRAIAAHGLGKTRASPLSMIPALMATLQDQDAVVRYQATIALSQFGSDAIDPLIQSLQANQQPVNVCVSTIYALGAIQATPAVPALITALQDDHEEVRQGAIWALEQIGEITMPDLIAALKSRDNNVRTGAAVVLGTLSGGLQDQSNSLSLSKLDQRISSLAQALSILEPHDLANPLAGSRFSAEAIAPVRRAFVALGVQRNAILLKVTVNVIFWVLFLLLLGGFVLLWLRPVVLIRLSRAIATTRQEQAVLGAALAIVTRFLEQAGAKVNRSGKRGLNAVTIAGRLKPLTPFPILIVLDQPTDQDVTELVQVADRLASNHSSRAGILLYREQPDTLFRVRMAEVRLRDRFVLIPIPLAAVEQAVIDRTACAGLLAQYADRYLPGADLFDDRNAIGDTLSFFGRAELLHRLEEELLRAQGVGLFGLRKSGKTSILLQLGFSLRRHPVIHIDLQPYGGKLRYGADLFNQILRKLAVLVSDRTPSLATNLELFTPDHPAAELTHEFIQRIGSWMNRLSQTGYELPILLFLDEIERILPTSTDPPEKVEEFNAFFGGLRALSQGQRQLGLLVADVHPDCNRINQWQQSGVPTNPVFSFFKEIFLPPFALEETTTMLTDIGRLMGWEFDAETLTAIHVESGGHPFIARQIASLLCAKIPEQGDRHITASAAHRYIQRPFTYSSVLKDYFAQNIWADLKKRNFEAAMAVLRILACNAASTQGVTEKNLQSYLSRAFTESQCLDALLWLETVGLIARVETADNDDNDIYQSNVPLLSRWLQMEMGEEEIRQWQIH